MQSFKLWLENEEEDDVKKTIKKLPQTHQNLVKGYSITFQAGNTIKGDDNHVGLIKNSPKKIMIIAAPYFHSREYVVLHEIAHLVWATFMTPKLKKNWGKIASKNKNNSPQNDEEEFCMSYAQYFAANKLTKYNFKEREEFIAQLVKKTG